MCATRQEFFMSLGSFWEGFSILFYSLFCELFHYAGCVSLFSFEGSYLYQRFLFFPSIFIKTSDDFLYSSMFVPAIINLHYNIELRLKFHRRFLVDREGGRGGVYLDCFEPTVATLPRSVPTLHFWLSVFPSRFCGDFWLGKSVRRLDVFEISTSIRILPCGRGLF